MTHAGMKLDYGTRHNATATEKKLERAKTSVASTRLGEEEQVMVRMGGSITCSMSVETVSVKLDAVEDAL